jgi:hypothetical protein
VKIKVIFIILFVSAIGNLQAQKGEINISAGPLASFASYNYVQGHQTAVGVGLEAKGEYNFSNRSAVVVQTGSTFYGLKNHSDTAARHHRTMFSIAAGYKYRFGISGFFANVLVGIDKYSDYNNNSPYFGIDAAEVPTATMIGVGKRFHVKDNYFIEAGVDFISNSYEETRVNLKVTCSLFP